MKTLLRLEELAQFLFGMYLFSLLPFAWWWFLVLILLPDISMLAYINGPRIGAFVYNFFHHKALGISVYILGSYFSSEAAMLAGIILYSHSCMDRIFGYGLKYPDSFQHTHLGRIGKEAGVVDNE